MAETTTAQELANAFLALWQRNLAHWAADPSALPARATLHGGAVWHPDLADEANALLARLDAADPAAVIAALGDRLVADLDGLQHGLDGYRRHPFRRRPRAGRCLLRLGATRLIDHGDELTAPDAPAVILVPSLVNGAEVLDLLPGRSLVDTVAAAGLRPMLLDWGTPGDAERGFDVDDYVLQRFLPAIDRAAAATGAPVILAGYCMGGNLALAAAAHLPDRVAGLVLLATPWDFSVPGGLGPLAPVLAAWVAGGPRAGLVPGAVLQWAFGMLDPALTLKKYSQFARLDPTDEAARLFVALEDWVNGGPPLPVAVARTVLGRWYRDNAPGSGAWAVGDQLVQPEAIAVPSLVAIPARDRIVPPASARPLARALPAAMVIEPPAGHVGMVVGRARQQLHTALGQWLGRWTATAAIPRRRAAAGAPGDRPGRSPA
ncbi:hypothetical protein CCR85_07740 [Rhodothalassium salexigens]|uniref:alpha/beta fold hydrolase n=1 Tax=Rhodothalassium salexigens TaxID=1086 RepID=UPI001914597B|nr:alpha/beta fold hydrolase [Rhodothalassium salexigens]MBK5911384.1 hypothetical protein [Rhodothalassium salexigens]